MAVSLIKNSDYSFLFEEPLQAWEISRPLYCGRWFNQCCWVLSIFVFWLGVYLEVEMSEPNLFTGGSVGVIAFWLLFKTPYIYKYRLHVKGAVRYDCVWQSEPLILAAKIFAVFCIVVTIAIALLMGSIFALVGVGGMGFMAAIGILNRKPAKTDRLRTCWSRHDRIFVDKHQKLVVVGYRDKQRCFDGFELVVDKKEMQPLVELLQTLMPQADVVNRKWVWHRGVGSQKEPD